MSGVYTPTFGVAASDSSSLDDRAVTTRARLVTQLNPYMADNLDAVTNMAMSGLDTPTLIATAGQSYAMQAADGLSRQLEGMNPVSQRAVFSQLSSSQQSALTQMGYKQPSRDPGSSLLGDVISGVASGVKFIGSGVAAIPGVSTVAHDALEGLTWVGNWPGHIYRTVRSLDDSGQYAGLIGAIAGVTAVALAIPTGGASLMALGGLGLGALGGATLGSMAAELTNPSDWMNAFNSSWDGEKTFDRPSKAKADALLHDGRMRSLASDLASSNLDIVTLAQEMAGQRDASQPSQIAKIEKLAGNMATKGTPQFDAAVKSMLNAIQEPVFQQAVQTLVDGKMSPGRDLIDSLPIDKHSGLYSALSGGVDAVFTLATDPMLMFGDLNEYRKAQQFTMRVFEGADAATEFMRVASKPGVLRYHEAVADAVSKAEIGGQQLMRSLNPSFERNYVDLVTHAQWLVDDVAHPLQSIREFGVKDLQEYYSGWANHLPMMQGIGSVTTAKGVQLMSMGRGVQAFREFRQVARSLVSGLSDVSLERDLLDHAKSLGEETSQLILDHLPPSYSRMVTEQGVIDAPWRLNQPNVGVYEAGRAIGEIPLIGRAVGKLGDVATSLSTMALSGKSVSLVGEKAVRDVRALSEMGRYMGMPSWSRQAWADAILSADSPATRQDHIIGWLDNVMHLTGAYDTQAGKDLIDQYMTKSKQIYGMNDALQIEGRKINAGLYLNEMADYMVMPNIHELFKASKNSFVAQKVMGVADLSIFDSAVNRIWKPATLLRIGFIPRAAGEEMAGFLARGGMGSLTQEAGGRFISRLSEYHKAVELQGLGRELSIQQRELLANGAWSLVPKHVRPIVRMAARLGFENPALEKMTQYGEWLSGHLQTGLGGFDDRFEQRLSNWAGQALDAPRNPADMNRIQQAAAHAMGADVHEGARLAIDSRIPSYMRLNAADYANAIVLGNKYSLRRMILGGVHDDQLAVGAAWFERHATTVMREVSASTHGPVANPYNTNDLITTPELNRRTGELELVRQHNIPGQRRYVAEGQDPYFRNGVHDLGHRTVNDPLVRPLLPYVGRVAGGTSVTEEQLGKHADALFNLGRDAGDTAMIASGDVAHVARQIMGEFVGGYDSRRWRAMVDELAKSKRTEKFATALDAYLPESERLTFQQVKQAVADSVSSHNPADYVSSIDQQAFRDLNRAHREARTAVQDARLEAAKTRGIYTSEREKLQGLLSPDERATLMSDLMTLDHEANTAEAGVAAAEKNAADIAASRRQVNEQIKKGEGAFSNAKLDSARLHKALDGDRTIAWLDGMDSNSRQFAAQFLHHQIVGKSESFWAQRKMNEAAAVAAGTPVDTAPWLYDTLGDAQRDLTSGLRTGMLDPNMHDEKVQNALRSIPRDAKGQALDTELRASSVMLYQAPPLRGLTFDQLLSNSANQPLLLAHRPLIEQIIAGKGDQAALVADYELAQELTNARARMQNVVAGRPLMMRQPRKITDGRVHGVLQPDVDTKVHGATQLWFYPKGGAEARLVPTPDGALDPIQEWADHAFNQLGDALGAKRKYELVPKTRTGNPLPDGTPTKEDLVFHYNELNQRVPWERGKPIPASDSNMLQTERGKQIIFGHPDYFEPDLGAHAPDVAENVMWDLVGPMMRDTYDDIHHATRWERSQASVMPGGGRLPIQSPDVVPVYRSKVTDVMKVPADDRPSFAISQLTDHKKVGTWEQVVNFGFSKVIGPSLDALVRQPMAYHAFAQHFLANRKLLDWTVDPVLRDSVERMITSFNGEKVGLELDMGQLAKQAKTIAAYHTDDVRALDWTNHQALSWLRGHSPDELRNTLVKVMTRSENGATPLAREANVYADKLQRLNPDKIQMAMAPGTNAREFLSLIESKLPAGALRSVNALGGASNQEAMRSDELLSWINGHEGGWDNIVGLHKNLAHIDKTAGEAAAHAAIADTVPFIHSHEFKTQFADHGQGFLPFWYAEENFLKRWGRGLAEAGPQLIRKAQLTYMGMKSAGIVRTDTAGKDWFVYPGSGLLTEAVSKMLPGLASVYDVGVMFQSPADEMLPGMSGKIGAPSFNPLVTIPMEIVTSHFPELQPIERSLLGDYATQRSVLQQIVPSHIMNIFQAVTGGMDANKKIASAQMSAIAYLEAHGQGLQDNATPDQIDEFMRKTRDHARVIVMAQALAGFTTPGPLTPVNAGKDESAGNTPSAGFGINDIGDTLSAEYVTLVRLLGVEAGTAKYLELNPKASLDHVVQPLAYTTPRNVSSSGAPLPATESALQWSLQNADYLHQMPDAAPWLLPQNLDGAPRSQYAYDQQTINGLRNRRTPEEYLRAMKFKEAAGEYFAMRDQFDSAIAQAELANNPTQLSSIKAEKSRTLMLYAAAHPVFNEQLTSSDGKQQRARTLNQMQYVINDPNAPQNEQTLAIGKAMRAFNAYQVQLSTLSEQRTSIGKAQILDLKAGFSDYMDTLTRSNPGIMSFWISVLRPEASLT